jgi:DNA invertase Pin-like site-specific DNA recombinase
VETRKPRITGEEREALAREVREEYERPGGTLASVAKARGIAPGTVRALVEEAGGEIRRRPPRVAPTYRPRLTGEARTATARSLAREYDEGTTIRGLARQRDMTYGTVRKLLVEGGARMRNRGGRVTAR